MPDENMKNDVEELLYNMRMEHDGLRRKLVDLEKEKKVIDARSIKIHYEMSKVRHAAEQLSKTIDELKALHEIEL